MLRQVPSLQFQVPWVGGAVSDITPLGTDLDLEALGLVFTVYGLPVLEHLALVHLGVI